MICGYNSAHNNNFYEIELDRIERKVNKKNFIYNKFYIQLIKNIAAWVSKIIHYIGQPELARNLNNKIKRAEKEYEYRKYKKEITNKNIHTWIFDNKEWMKYKRKNKIEKTDIIIATDGSFKNNKAGIGIYIEHKNKKYNFWQTLGNQTVNYAELFALGKIKYLLEKFKINYNNKRIFILTDSMYAYEKSFKKPDRYSKKPFEYYELHKETIETIWDLKPTLIKVPSHLDEKRNMETIKPNDIADLLAEKARKSKPPQNLETPTLKDWTWSYAESHDHLEIVVCGNASEDWNYYKIDGAVS